MKTKKIIPVDFCAAVAKLHLAGWSKDRIVQEFTYRSKHDVPAALKRAMELGFLTRPELVLDACAANGISDAQIDAVILGANLTAGLRSHSTSLRAIHVFYPSTPEKIANFDYRLADFAPFAARQVADIMSRLASRSIGVSWGLSPRVVIDALAQLGTVGTAPRKIFPITGLPLHKYFGNRVASESAARLHHIINGVDAPFNYSIPLVPALIPVGAEEQFQQLFENYSPGYKEVFGSGPIGGRTGGLVDNADMILTSVSSQRALGELLEADVVNWAKIGKYAELHESVDGDIAGVLLRKKRKTNQLLDEFDRHWTGITRAAIEQCSRRAQDKKHPSAGVCVVAIDENKAAIVLKCLLTGHETEGHARHTGLISHLICDYSLAMKLMRLAKAAGVVSARPAIAFPRAALPG
jgi:hypothetical protein